MRRGEESRLKITNDTTCLFDGAAILGHETENERKIKCIWVGDEKEGNKGQEVQVACTEVTSKVTCDFPGSVV
jgi:hypothetical protein